MADTKRNDWLAIIVNQPQFTFEDMQEFGITPDNTTIKSRDYYKNLPQIQQMFDNGKGKFDETAFENFYQGALVTYNEYAQNQFDDEIIKSYDPYDWTAPIGSKKIDTSATISFGDNPERRSYGISNLQEIGKGKSLSTREIAQTNKVYDPISESFLDWTPNDKGGILKGLNRPTLVLAQYEEDGTHEVNGRKFKHQKGELKLNEEGEPFYEILGDREVAGREVLKYADTLTIDGSKWNKYDFFDSDGVDKSIGGVIMKTVAGVAPMLIPGVGTIFGAISASMALTQLLPILGKSISNIFNGDTDTHFEKTLNKIQNWGAQFGSSVSDKSKEKIATWENLGELVKDVSLQLFQQQTISKIPMLFGKTAQNAELGRNLALAYMAGTSAQEAYSSFKEAGANDAVAGWGMLASMLAMWKLMNIDYFRDSLFKGTAFDESVVKKPIREASKELAEKAKFMKPQQAFKFMENKLSKKVIDAAKKVKDILKVDENGNILNSPMVTRAWSEGIEETMEEISQDLVKTLFTGLDALGIPMTSDDSQSLDFNWSIQNALTRYGVSFVGGAIGGPIFELHNRWQNQLNNDITKHMNRSSFSQLTYMLAQGKKDEIMQYLDLYHKKGKFGSKNLSGTQYEIKKDESGNLQIVYEAAENEGDSQNDIIYKSLKSWVENQDRILQEEGLSNVVLLSNTFNLPEDNKMLEAVNTIGANSSKLSDIQNIAEQILKTRNELDAITEKNTSNTDSDAKKQQEAISLQANGKVKDLQAKLLDLRKKWEEIKTGKLDGYYINQAKFVLHTDISDLFAITDKERYALLTRGTVFSQLNPKLQDEVQEEFDNYMNFDAKLRIFKGYDVYLNASQRFAPQIQEANESLKSIKLNELYTGNVQGTVLQAWAKEVEILDQERKQLEEKQNKESLTSEEETRLKEIVNKIKDINEKTESLMQTPSKLLLEETTPEFTFFDRKKLDNYNSINAKIYADGLLDYYKYLASHNIVSKGDKDLYFLMSQIVKNYSTSKLYGRIRDAFNNNFFNIEEEALNGGDRGYQQDSYLQEVYGEEINGEYYSLAGDLYTPDDPGRSGALDDLTSLVDKFNLAVQRDAKEALSIYQQMIDLLIQHPVADEKTKQKWEENPESKKSYLKQVESFIKSILPTVNEVGKLNEDGTTSLGQSISVIDYLIQIDEIKQNIKQSAFLDILNDFIVDVNEEPNNLLQVIQQEKRRLLNQVNAEDYVIENKQIEQQLNDAFDYIKIVEALINGAYSGLNESINNSSKIYKLATIDENTKNIIASEINSLKSELGTLSLVSGMNNMRRLSVHQKVMTNMRPKFIQSLLKYKTSLADEKTGLGIKDLDALYDKYFGEFPLSNITLNNFKDYEKQIFGFETELHQQLSSLSSNPDELIDRIIGSLNEDIWKKKSTELTDKDDEMISGYDLAVYLTKTAVLDPNKFYTEYRDKIIKNDSYEYAPTLGQELAIQLATAYFENPEIFSKLNQKLHEKYSGNINYLTHKPVLNNIIKILGSTGSGKTTAVDRGIYTMLKDKDIDFIYVAPNDAQVERLVDSIKPDDLNANFVFNKQNFLTKLTSADKDGKLITFKFNKDIEHFVGTTKVKPSSLFTETKKKVVFVDEISTWNEPELTLLSKWAIENHAIIVATGDETQNSAKVYYDGKWNDSGLEDVEMISSTYLNYTLRANSIAAIDNFNILYSILKQVRDKYNNNPELRPDDLNKEVGSLLSKGITIKYYSNTKPNVDDKLLAGTQIVNSTDDVKKWLNIFKEQLPTIKGKVLLITDNPELYNADKDPDLDIRKPDEAQGLEYDYVVMDIKWTKDDNKYNQLRNFYTMTQRARLGSIVLDNGIIDSLKIENEFSPLAKNDSEITKEQKSKYKEWRGESLAALSYTEPEATVLTSEDKPSDPTPPGSTQEKQNDDKKPSGAAVNNKDGEKQVRTNSTGETPSEDPNNIGKINIDDANKHDEEQSSSLDGSHTGDDVYSDTTPDQVVTQILDGEDPFPIPEGVEIDDTKIRGNLDYKSSNEEFIKSRFKDPRYVASNKDEYFNWTQTNLLRTQRRDNDSLYNALEFDNDEDFIKLARQIGDALMFDSSFDVSDWESMSNLNKLYPNQRTKQMAFENWFRSELLTERNIKRNGEEGRFLNEDNYDLSIEAIGDKRFLVAKFNINNKKASLPIAIVKTNITGKLNEKHPFKLVRGTTKHKKVRARTLQQAEQDGRIKFSDPVIISATKDGPVNFMTDTIREFVFGKYDETEKQQIRQPQNGKTVAIVTDNINATPDKLRTKLQFEVDENGTPTYLYREADKYALIGVHRNASPSEVIKAIVALYATMIDTDAYWSVVSASESNDIRNSKTKEAVLAEYLNKSGINSPQEAYDLINKYIPNYNRTEGQKPWETFGDDKKKAWSEFFKYYGDKSRQAVNFEVAARLVSEVMNEFYRGDNALYLSKESRRQIRNNLFEILKSKSYRSNGGKSRSKDRVLVNFKTGVRNYARVLIEAEPVNNDRSIKYTAYRFENNKAKSKIGDSIVVSVQNDIDFPLYGILSKIFPEFGLNINKDFTPDKVTLSFCTLRENVDQDGKLIPNSGVLFYSPSNQILYNIFKKVESLNQVDNLVAHSNYFKEGLFNNDVAGNALFTPNGEQIRTVFREVKNEGIFTEDVAIEGSVFEVDLSKIDTTINESAPSLQKEFYDDLDQLKEFLITNNIPYKISPVREKYNPDQSVKEQLDELIQEINYNLKNSATDTKYPIISTSWRVVDQNQETERQRISTLNIIYTDNWENLVSNLLNKIGIKPLALNRDFIKTGNIRNIATFSVTLENNIIKRYIAKRTGNNWEIKEFLSYKPYLTAWGEIEGAKTSLTTEEYTTIKTYFDSIQDNETSYNVMEAYQILMRNKAGDPVFEKIHQKINDYLLERLKNNEC